MIILYFRVQIIYMYRHLLYYFFYIYLHLLSKYVWLLKNIKFTFHSKKHPGEPKGLVRIDLAH